MPSDQRIYLDHAATSWPKPEGVYAAVDSYMRNNGAPGGRGVYRHAIESDRVIDTCRARLAELFRTSDPSRYIITHNCTDSLNMALHGLLRRGDKVITTDVEHNSVLRPLRHLEERLGVKVERVRCDRYGVASLDELEEALQWGARMVVMSHASNVTGALQPVEEVGRLAATAGAIFVLDAAQTAGTMPINLTELGVHVMCCSGHKGLLGPLGTGVMYLAPQTETEMLPLRQGGTGTLSDDDHQPTTMPDRFETGNANLPGIAGLSAGVAYLLQRNLETLRTELSLNSVHIRACLRTMPGIAYYGPEEASRRTAIVSLNVAGYDPRDLAALLDVQYGVQARAGVHCAPRIHRRLGTYPTGTLRLSWGATTTGEEIDAAIEAIREIAKSTE